MPPFFHRYNKPHHVFVGVVCGGVYECHVYVRE
jgi:hypothetical protein